MTPTTIPAPTSLPSLLTAAIPPELAATAATVDAHGSPCVDGDLPLGQQLHWLALENWIYACHRMLPQAQGLQAVRGLMEACHHSRALGQWSLAYHLTCWPVGREGVPLHEQLGRWGHYRAQIELYGGLVGKLGPEVDLLCWHGLGAAHCHLGEFKLARPYHEQQLQWARAQGDRSAEAQALEDFGQWCYDQHNYSLAIHYFQQQYQLVAPFQSDRLRVTVLGKLGRTYCCTLKIQKGLSYLKQALDLSRGLGCRALELKALADLGYGYFRMNATEEAIACLETVLAELDLVGDLALQASVLRNLGTAYGWQGNVHAAMACGQEALALSRRAQNPSLECILLIDIGLWYNWHEKNYDQAIVYAQASLSIAHRIGSHYDAIMSYTHLALHSAQKQDLVNAESYVQTALHLLEDQQDLIDCETEALVLACIAKVHWVSGRQLWAFFTVCRSLWLLPPWQSINGRVILKNTVATLTPSWLQRILKRR
ncbi:tetratricopeptide repeat protein [Leptolyngbya sp. PCC 6406]|uniref:tetratricopeptide repeat protein n=1 Tax=Leptolyngbya sp. PCC 6406 TaxID=1173264 RepID=UPI0002ABCFD4|nr:tetratricopeptide repeat protein [Leptolyngbya sp. PCC 6406]